MDKKHVETLNAHRNKKKRYRKRGRLPKIAHLAILPRVLALIIGCVFGANTAPTENNKVRRLTLTHFKTQCKVTGIMA